MQTSIRSTTDSTQHGDLPSTENNGGNSWKWLRSSLGLARDDDDDDEEPREHVYGGRRCCFVPVSRFVLAEPFDTILAEPLGSVEPLLKDTAIWQVTSHR